MKKVISLLAALAVVASSVVAFAAPTATSSNPAIKGSVDSIDGDGYAVLYFALENNETLVDYSINKGKVTLNGINAIQAQVKLNSDVFDVTETYLTPNATIGGSGSGDNTDTLTYVKAYTEVSAYLTSVPEYLFKVEALLKDGYDMSNIPDDAVSFGTCKVEYTSYAAQKPSDGTTTYTIYAANTAAAHDYELATSFKGTGTVTPPEPEKFEAKVDTDSGEITFENAALSENNKEIGGKAIKIFGKTFTVNAKSKFVISAQGTTKTFGKTAAEYLGLEGDGEATGNVTVGIIYDKEQYKASDFTISAE